MLSGDEAKRRAERSRARLAAHWRPLMQTWATFRGATWKVDRIWTARRLLAHMEILKGNGEWCRLAKAPREIVLIDEGVADLAGCVIARGSWDAEYQRFRARDPWDRLLRYAPELDREPYCYDNDDPAEAFFEDRDCLTWDLRIAAARERAADLLGVHYLLPHARLYQKLRAFGVGERAYYYRLGAALGELGHTCRYRIRSPGNVQF